MKVKIIKCSQDTFWYADKIGDCVDIIDTNHFLGYMLLEDDGKKVKRYILKSDCEIVSEDKLKNVKSVPYEIEMAGDWRCYRTRCLSKDNGVYVGGLLCSKCKYNQGMSSTSVKCSYDTQEEAHVQKSNKSEHEERDCDTCRYNKKDCFSIVGYCRPSHNSKWQPKEAKEKPENDCSICEQNVNECLEANGMYCPQEKPKKLKLKISKSRFELLQELLCKGCTDKLSCGICTINLERYVKVVK